MQFIYELTFLTHFSKCIFNACKFHGMFHFINSKNPVIVLKCNINFSYNISLKKGKVWGWYFGLKLKDNESL